MAKIFISHAASDLALASDVEGWLDADQHETFLDRDLSHGIALGDNWEQRLHERLRWADAIVCLVSKAYIESTWCSAEVGIARSRGIRILPLITEPGVKHPLLGSLQHISVADDRALGRVALTSALRRIEAAAGKHGWPDGRSPFPGLRHFDSDQHRIFFGRHDETRDLIELLCSPAESVQNAVLLVVGPSGCGKSSLVRAGVIPLLAEEPDWWTMPVITPGQDPVAALIRQLVIAGRSINQPWTTADIRRRINDGELRLVIDELLTSTPERPTDNLLIAIDQYEELLTQADRSQRLRFAELQQSALAASARIIGTLRSESMELLLTNAELTSVPHRIHTLYPLKRNALEEVICGPAEVAGIEIGKNLVADLVADTGTGEALPLLAYTLSELADGVTRGGQLRRSQLELLGGVRGTLVRQADAALNDAVSSVGRSTEHVISSLLQLVTLDDAGHPTRWRVEYDPMTGEVKRELNAFVARRLLTTDAENGQAVIEVSHEAFLSAWPPLAEAIKSHSSALQAKKAVESASAEWNNASQTDSRLWEGNQLANAISDLEWQESARTSRSAVRSVALSISAEAFLRASIRRARRRRRGAISILSLLLSMAVVGLVVAVNRQLAAEEQQRLATTRQLTAQADALQTSDERTAMRLRIAAQSIEAGSATRNDLTRAVIESHYESRLAAHDSSVNAVAFAPDGGLLATGDANGVILLWDVRDPLAPRRIGPALVGHKATVTALDFAPRDKLLASVGEDGQLIIWNVEDPAYPWRVSNLIADHSAPLLSLAFAPDGRVVATGSANHTAELWDLADPAHPRVSHALVRHVQAVAAVAFSPDGHTLATAGRDGAALLWNVHDPSNPAKIGSALYGDASSLTAVTFTPDGKIIATASDGGNVYLWNIENPAAPRKVAAPLSVGRAAVNAVSISRDGTTLATAGADGTAVLWDIKDPGAPHRLDPPFAAYSEAMTTAAFAPDGRTLATAGADHTATLWLVVGEAPQHILGPGSSQVTSVAAGPTGALVATGYFDGTTHLWSATDAPAPRSLDQRPVRQPGPVLVAELSYDGRSLVTGGPDGNSTLWDVSQPAMPRRRSAITTGDPGSDWAATFSPDGRTLAIAGGSTVSLWDVTAVDKPLRLGGSLQLPEWVVYLSFSPDGRLLATSSLDGSVALWDITNREAPRVVGRIAQYGRSRVLFVDDRTLVTTRDRGVDLWDIDRPETPRLLSSISDLNTGSTPAIALPRRRSLLGYDALVIGDNNGNAEFWDIADPARPQEVVSMLSADTGAIAELDIADDGRTLVTIDNEKTVTAWDLRSLAAAWTMPRQAACAIAGRALNPQEWSHYVPGLNFRDTCSPPGEPG